MKVNLSNGDKLRIYFRYDGNVVTTCILEDALGILMTAEAICAPQDQFNKAIGRKVALTKALKNLGPAITKDERREIWDDFLETHCVFTK